MSTVYQRPNSPFWYYDIPAPGGGRSRRSTRTTRKREAERIAREALAELERAAKQGRVARPGGPVWGEALARWIREDDPASQAAPIRIVAREIPYDTPLLEVPDKVWAMRERMREKGLKSATINRRLSVARRVLNLAWKRWRWIEVPLGQRIEMLSEANSSREVDATEEDIARLLAEVRHPEVRRLALLASWTGLRKGELLRLEPADWIPPTIVVRKSKGGRPRRVPLPEALHSIVLPLPIPVTSDQVRYQVDRARERSGVDTRFHDLRHVYATRYGDLEDVPPAILQQLLGHRDLATTSRYVQAREAIGHAERLYEKLQGTIAAHSDGTLH